MTELSKGAIWLTIKLTKGPDVTYRDGAAVVELGPARTLVVRESWRTTHYAPGAWISVENTVRS